MQFLISLQIKLFLWLAFTSIKEIHPSSKFQNIVTLTRWKLPVQLSSVKSSQTLICEKFSSNIAWIKTVGIVGPAFYSLKAWWTNHSLGTKHNVFLAHTPEICFKNALKTLTYRDASCFWNNQANAAKTTWFSSYIVVKGKKDTFKKNIIMDGSIRIFQIGKCHSACSEK